jgi:hypothetical protein
MSKDYWLFGLCNFGGNLFILMGQVYLLLTFFWCYLSMLVIHIFKRHHIIWVSFGVGMNNNIEPSVGGWCCRWLLKQWVYFRLAVKRLSVLPLFNCFVEYILYSLLISYTLLLQSPTKPYISWVTYYTLYRYGPWQLHGYIFYHN